MIKKEKNKNEYILACDGMWVRDFTKPMAKAYDVNDNLLSLEDMKIILANEEINCQKIYQKIDTEDIIHDKIVVVSDGTEFNNIQPILEKLPNDVVIFGVNGAFANWKSQRRLTYIIINNPYEESIYYYPPIIRHWPKCITSTRTNPVFVSNYKGLVYVYKPTPNTGYSGPRSDFNYFIDDYRNPVCASIGLAYKFRVKKLLLLSILDLYEQERPGTEKTKDGKWVYPQQKTAHALIDANLYWLKKANIKVGYNDVGLDYNNATYISEKDIKGFFDER